MKDESGLVLDQEYGHHPPLVPSLRRATLRPTTNSNIMNTFEMFTKLNYYQDQYFEYPPRPHLTFQIFLNLPLWANFYNYKDLSLLLLLVPPLDQPTPLYDLNPQPSTLNQASPAAQVEAG